MADHGHDVTMPAHLGAQNAEAVLGVVVGDALDKARQNFGIRRFRLRPHVAVISVNLMGRKPEFFSEAAGEAARRCVFSNPHPEGTASNIILAGHWKHALESIDLQLPRAECAERTEE